MVDFAKKLREMKRSQQEEAEVAKSPSKAESNEVAQKTGLPEVIDSNYRALTVSAEELTKDLVDSVGVQGLKPSDLDKIKVPTGGAEFWSVETLEGAVPMKALEGIILQFKEPRGYWKEKTGVKTPPDCRSDDGITGIGTIASKFGGNCLSCPMAQFHTAVNEKGQPAAGQACKQKRVLLFLRQDDLIPVLVSLPATSIKNARQYFLRLVNNGMKYYGVVTQLRLEKHENATGDPYSMATLAPVRALKPDEFARVMIIGQALREMFSQMTVVDIDATDAE